MMKDLILITAYCPDDTRENILRDLVTSLLQFKNEFEVMIVSHTPIPMDIQKKVEYCVYDKKNEILTDWDLLNKPWFMPGERRILSSFLSKKNTHLAVWRLMILGFINAKNIGFSKVHHIEYDCIINDVSEFIDNSQLLNENNSVVYIDKKYGVDDVMFGSCQSYFIPKIPQLLIKLDEEKIKDLIRNANPKSPEGLLYKLLEESGNIVVKNRDLLEKNGNKFGVINSQSINKNPWSVPYYDYFSEEVEFVVWNTTNSDWLEHKIIINESILVYIPKTNFNCWKLRNLGKLEEINSIIVIEIDQLRDTFYLNTDYDREIFKKMSYREK